MVFIWWFWLWKGNIVLRPCGVIHPSPHQLSHPQAKWVRRISLGQIILMVDGYEVVLRLKEDEDAGASALFPSS